MLTSGVLSADVHQQLRFAVLGPLQAWRGDTHLELGPIREQALLTALLLRPGMTVSRQQLLDGVWGTEPPGTGTKVIPAYVHRLRRRLDARGRGSADSLIVTDRGGYRFVPRNARVDVAQLEETVTEGRSAKESGDLDAAVDAWSRALALFRSEPLAGIPGPFAEGERLRLAEHRLVLVQEKLECQLWLGRHTEAVGELFALMAMHPCNEALAALLMRALYAGNRQAESLKVFATVRRRLVSEQGAEPGALLRRVHKAVLRGDDAFFLGTAVRQGRPMDNPTARRRPAAPRRERRVRNELPVAIGNFTGRARELELLVAPTDAQVVTVRAVDGMAGVGKTALVVRAARILRERYPDGCLFVELHGHREDRGTVGAHRTLRRLLRAVGSAEGEDSDDPDELTAAWRAATASLQLLLVLDDASGAGQVRPLLPAGSGSMVVVTSRRRLTGLDADHRISLPPLDIDEAAGLLARIVGGEGCDRGHGAVHELAALCDRLPLALRIVGARLQNRPLWAVEALAARLADDERRLDELAVEGRSVEVAFRISYGQLPAAEQRAFRALGLSPTVRFDRLTLAAMLDSAPSDAERALKSLVDASLVQQVAADRYRLHDLVAVYARRVAAVYPDEAAGFRSGVFRLYVAAARCASDLGASSFLSGPQGTGPFADWAEATTWLDAAGGELVDVIGRAVALGHLDEACWIVEGLVDYLSRQGRFHECRTTLEILLPLLEQVTDLRMVSALRTCLGIVYGLRGRYQQARTWLTEALDISRRAGDLHEQARAAAGLGTFANLEGRIAESMVHFADVANLAGQLNDDWLTGLVMTRVGDMHHRLGEHDKAYGCYTEAIALAGKTGSPRLHGKTLLRLGSLQLDLQRHADAAGTLGKAEELSRRLGDLPLHSAVLDRLSAAEEGLGNLETAAELRRRSSTVLGMQTGTESELAIRNRLVWHDVAAEDLAGTRDFFERATALPDTEANRARVSQALDRLRRRLRPGAGDV